MKSILLFFFAWASDPSRVVGDAQENVVASTLLRIVEWRLQSCSVLRRTWTNLYLHRLDAYGSEASPRAGISKTVEVELPPSIDLYGGRAPPVADHLRSRHGTVPASWTKAT